MLEKRSGRLCPRILTLSISFQENPGATAIGRMIRRRSDVHAKRVYLSLKAPMNNFNPSPRLPEGFFTPSKPL
ncbi:hypothetical protein PAEVO_40860 [Paenibacillus sp. GM2FR]|nr:hypothetical protein PAEVO_40860 [Paenibacillus sp. GM2FR]